MAKKLFIIIEYDQNGRVSDFTVEDSLLDNEDIFDLGFVKKSKCPDCACDLNFSMFAPRNSKCEMEVQDDVYEVIQEEVLDDEHFVCEVENEENISVENLTLKSPPKRTERKRSKIKENRANVKREMKKESETEETCCPTCFKTFRMPSTLRVHIQRCHAPKSQVCHLCGTAFVRNKELQDHLLRHENPKPYECDLCLERYAVKNSLREHMRTCHIGNNSEGFYCEFCNNSKKYSTETKLLDHHDRVHSGNDRYHCQQCPRRFKYPESLRNHLVRYHTPPELMHWYSCDECNFRGSTAKALEKHKLVHLDNSEKPFKCSYEGCNKGFGRRYEWNRHEMIHRSEKPFICGICGHSVRTNYLLQKHMRVHQEGRPYACPLCDKTYRDRDTYKKHMKAHAVQMEAKGEHLNLEETLQHIANVHKTIPIKAKSFPVILSSAADEETGETLLLTEVQEDFVIETTGSGVKEDYTVVVSK